MAVRQRSKHELVAALQAPYRRADRAGKVRLLDEFCAATGYHRKHPICLLRDGPPAPRAGHGGRGSVYSSIVIGALRLCAEASGWLCGKCLAPFLAELVPALEAEGALRLEPLVRSQLLALSAATIDRRLQPFDSSSSAASAPPSQARYSNLKSRSALGRRGKSSASAS
jgi:hypothetical protein